MISIKHGQPVDWIVSLWAHSVVPAKDIFEQCVEFLQSQATFWSRPENREYLVDVMVAMADKSPGAQTELQRMVDRVRVFFVSPSARTWLERTARE